MGNEVGNSKFTWVIKNFPSLGSKKIYSDEFVIGGCKWRLLAYPKGNSDKNAANHLSLFLVVADATYLHFGWKRHAKISFTVVNQFSEDLSKVIVLEKLYFNQNASNWGCTRMIDLDELKSKNGGFMVDGEVKIVAKVDVLSVIGELDVPEETEEATQPRKKIKLEETSSDWVDVNGFQVLPSQAEFVKRIFEKNPNMALDFQEKNQRLRTACMNILISLIETLCQSLQDLSIDGLGQADNALTYLKNSGFKVDWLERKLEEVKEKKMEEEIGEIRVQELEEEVKGFKQKCSDIEALLENKKEELKELKKKCLDTEALLKKEKAKVLAARAPPLTLDDVV